MSQLPMLIQREYWEHKTTFFYLPAVITCVAFAILLFAALGMKAGVIDEPVLPNAEVMQPADDHLIDLGVDGRNGMSNTWLLQFAASPFERRQAILERVCLGVSLALLPVMWIVSFFYLLHCLYEERKDRSILFWKSLPISDGITVLTKLICAMFLLPFIYLVFIMILQLGLLFSAFVFSMGQPVDFWNTFWLPARLIDRWLMMSVYIFVAAFWCLPLYGWLLAVSSWCRSAPFAWVLGLPILLVILEKVFLSGNQVSDFISRHRFSATSAEGMTLQAALDRVITWDMLAAVIVGGMLVLVAVWRRSYADEI
ncbi:MAG: hypothetical protein KUG79_03520 [Pseudomonadales bacterium]|nr:hypothetical protein [Pseudomonadales bacterium]